MKTKSFREFLTENEQLANKEDYKTKIFDEIAKSNGFTFKSPEEEEKAREAFATSQTNTALSSKDKEEAKQEIINTYGTSNVKATKSDRKKLDYIKANYEIAEKVLAELNDFNSYDNKEMFKSFKKCSKTDIQAEITSFADNIVKNRYDSKSPELIFKCVKALLIGATVKNFDKENEYQNIVDHISVSNDERNTVENKIRKILKSYDDFGTMIGYGNFGGSANELSSLIGAEDSEILKYAKLASSETPKDHSGKFTLLDSRGRVPPKKETGETGKLDISGTDDEASSNGEEKSTDKNEAPVSISTRKEIPLDLKSYKDEVDKMVNSELERLKKKFNIQESVINSIDKTLTEMTRATHDKDGNETEVYKGYKERAKNKFVSENGSLESARQDAYRKLEKYFTEYNDKIITTNKKAALKIKIMNVIPELKKQLIKSGYSMTKKLTQNEVGISMDAAKNDISNAAKGIKKAVTQNAVSRNIADKASTLKKQFDADKPARDEKKADAKATREKNTEEAKAAAEAGGDGGIVGAADQVKKAVGNKLKDVWFGRKKAAEQAKAQATPQQQSAQEPQVATPQASQPVYQQPAPPAQLALPAPNPATPTLTPEQLTQAQNNFKPKMKEETPEEKAAREANEKRASVNTTQMIKKVNKAMKIKIR